MRAARVQQERRQRVRNAMRARVRRVTALGEPTRALAHIPGEPLVARLPTDAVPRTELGHRVGTALMIGDELQPLVHRGHLLPGHRSSRERAAQTVECHPSCRNILLPINPVYTRLMSNVSLQLTGDGWEEVVVAAALVRTVSRQHLPSDQVARS